MYDKSKLFLILLIAALFLLGGRAIYERLNPVILHGKDAKIIVIPSTGKDINSPVSYLFGRAPYFLICDKSKGTYKAVINKYMDAQHAAGLRISQLLAKKKIDVVCANNIGFEPARVFTKNNIEMYTDIKPTVWQTLSAFPDVLTKINKQNVPSHFGITGSKKQIACSSFDTQANIGQIVQGRFYICDNCGFRINEKLAEKNTGKLICPKCSKSLRMIIAVTSPHLQAGGVKPKIKVF